MNKTRDSPIPTIPKMPVNGFPFPAGGAGESKVTLWAEERFHVGPAWPGEEPTEEVPFFVEGEVRVFLGGSLLLAIVAELRFERLAQAGQLDPGGPPAGAF